LLDRHPDMLQQVPPPFHSTSQAFAATTVVLPPTINGHCSIRIISPPPPPVSY
jgi:hypothetical protein